MENEETLRSNELLATRLHKIKTVQYIFSHDA